MLIGLSGRYFSKTLPDSNKKDYQAPNATAISVDSEGMLAASGSEHLPVVPDPGIPAANERQFAWDGNYWE